MEKHAGAFTARVKLAAIARADEVSGQLLTMSGSKVGNAFAQK